MVNYMLSEFYLHIFFKIIKSESCLSVMPAGQVMSDTVCRARALRPKGLHSLLTAVPIPTANPAPLQPACSLCPQLWPLTHLPRSIPKVLPVAQAA